MSDQSDNRTDEQPDVEDLLDDLEELEDVVNSPEEQRLVRETMRTARRVRQPSVFGRVIRGFDHQDAAEALVGSTVFGIPMLVESGTLEIGAYIASRPLYYLATLAFGVALVVGILYVADIQRVEIRDPLFGVLPRRLVAVVGISFFTALSLMTVWGRVDWSTPTVALAQVSVTFVAMAIGASLGDILPGS